MIGALEHSTDAFEVGCVLISIIDPMIGLSLVVTCPCELNGLDGAS